jgi:hypothetical protein
MKQQNYYLTLFVGAVLACAAGCSEDSGAPGDTGGTGGSGAGGSGAGGAASSIDIKPDASGWVQADTNTLGIQGAWYSYADSIGKAGAPPGDCQSKGMHTDAECSVVKAPLPGGFPNTDGKMCTEGTVAKVINLVSGGTGPDYDNVWGAGIALDLNNSGADAGNVSSPFNATAKGVVGFSFDIDATPLSGLRVEFPTPTTTAGANYWGAAANGNGKYPNSPVKPGTNTIKWADVTSPDTAKVAAFDATQVLAVQFHVPANTTSSGDYKFCISNLKALTQ